MIAIDGFSAQSLPGVLDRLSALGEPYRFSQRFIVLNSHDAKADIKILRRQLRLAEVPVLAEATGLRNPPVNEDAAATHRNA